MIFKLEQVLGGGVHPECCAVNMLLPNKNDLHDLNYSVGHTKFTMTLQKYSPILIQYATALNECFLSLAKCSKH